MTKKDLGHPYLFSLSYIVIEFSPGYITACNNKLQFAALMVSEAVELSSSQWDVSINVGAASRFGP